MNILSFLLIDWQKWRPESLFGGQVLERTPAGLTIVYSISMGVLLVILIFMFIENFRRPKFVFERSLPREVNKKLTQTLANRSIMLWHIGYILLAFFVFGTQVYWVKYAQESNEDFSKDLASKDLRSRRTNAASLKGWMLDRTGKLDAALALYKIAKDGSIQRTFPLEKEMAHLLGTERGSPGLERTLYHKEADPMPEAWEILTKYKKPEPEQKDVRTTIDKDLQMFAAKQLEGKKGAIVVMNPQTGDVLAIYSNPSFNLAEAQTLDGYLKLEANKEQKPLLDRATREFYVPGSTFKTLTTMAAYRSGLQNTLLPDVAEGYIPVKGSRAIHDAGGSCELCRNDVPLREAFKVSSNQYFAQLGNVVGREKMAETARLLGIAAVDTPEDVSKQGFFADIWNASNPRIARALAPSHAVMVTGKGISLYDFGLEGMGQGYASQMTPFQMALIASAPGNMQGRLMKPKIEFDLQPQIFNQVLTPQMAAEIRDVMSTVTEESGGTGGAVKSALAGTNIIAGGKTGTANKAGAPLFDKNGERRFVMKKKKNDDGEMVEYKEYLTFDRVDGWFICIAPLTNAQVAIAVVIEDIGGKFGGTTAAPIAAQVILKARDLGLLGDAYKPRTTAPPPKKRV